MPEPEGSPRLSKQLSHLGIGLMAVMGEKEITEDIYSVLCRVGSDLIPRLRFKIIKYLWDSRAFLETGKIFSTTEVASGTELNGKTVLRTLQDMGVIGLAKGELVENDQGKPFVWRLTEKAVRLIGASQVFDD